MHDAMIVVEVMEEDAEDGIKWRRKIRCGEPGREKPKEQEEYIV